MIKQILRTYRQFNDLTESEKTAGIEKHRYSFDDLTNILLVMLESICVIIRRPERKKILRKIVAVIKMEKNIELRLSCSIPNFMPSSRVKTSKSTPWVRLRSNTDAYA